MPEQWAVDIANRMKASRDEFQHRLDGLEAASHDPENVFVSATREIIKRINSALKDAAESYGIDPD